MTFEISPSPWCTAFESEMTSVHIRDADGNRVADVEQRGTDRTASNAKLLAAAPRLLELAKEMLELDEQGVFGSGDGSLDGLLFLAEVREVIRDIDLTQ